MSREIELKVPLSEALFQKIQKILTEKNTVPSFQFHSLSHILKSDEYFSLYNTHEERIKNKELKVIRLRTQTDSPLEPSGIDMYGDDSESKEKAYFCIKHKTLENGVEFNSEYETFVENPDVLRKFFEATGYIKWFEKKKDALSVFCTLSDFTDFEAHLEIEKVNGLPYAEIEYTKENVPSETVRPRLKEILRALGIDPKNRDSRSWAQIITEAKQS